MLNKKTFNEAKELDYSSVQKAIGILLSFVPENKPIGTLQLSTSLGLNKSTVSRLIQVLVHFGLIQQDEASQEVLPGQNRCPFGKGRRGFAHGSTHPVRQAGNRIPEGHRLVKASVAK